MTNLKIPYSEMELQVAMISLSNREETEIKIIMKESVINFDEKFGDSFNTKAELNKRVSEENGITIKDLIDSPNYENLINEFKSSAITETVDIMIDKGLTHIEAWALMSVSIGLLHD